MLATTLIILRSKDKNPIKKLFLLKWTTFFLIKKTCIKPSGAYLISGTPEEDYKRRGLIREGCLFAKSSGKDIYGCYSILLCHILKIQHTILRVKCTHSLSETLSKFTCKFVEQIYGNSVMIYGI